MSAVDEAIAAVAQKAVMPVIEAMQAMNDSQESKIADLTLKVDAQSLIIAELRRQVAAALTVGGSPAPAPAPQPAPVPAPVPAPTGEVLAISPDGKLVVNGVVDDRTSLVLEVGTVPGYTRAHRSGGQWGGYWAQNAGGTFVQVPKEQFTAAVGAPALTVTASGTVG